MKKTIFLISVLFFMCAAESYSQEVFFPTKKGAVLRYVAKNGSGEVLNYSSYTVTGVSGEGERVVDFRIDLCDGDSLPQPEKCKRSKARILNGDVHIDPSPFLNTMMDKVEFVGGSTVFPADMEVGKMLDDFILDIKVARINTHLYNYDVTVMAKEKITVPAGTFDCYKVRSTNKARVMGFTVENTTYIWYAKGIGPVRMQIANKKDKFQSSQELLSYTE